VRENNKRNRNAQMQQASGRLTMYFLNLACGVRDGYAKSFTKPKSSPLASTLQCQAGKPGT
jgi:hypothetical protein